MPLLVIIMIGIFFYNPISKHNLLTKYYNTGNMTEIEYFIYNKCIYGLEI